MSERDTNHGSVELFLLSEFRPLPAHTNQFDIKNYRPTGVVWPLQEFDGIFQLYRHASLCPKLERQFTTGDAIVIRYDRLNLITTLVVLDRRSPILWNGEPHRLFEGDTDDRVLLQLPKSFHMKRTMINRNEPT